MNALIGFLAWQGVDGDLEIASQEPRAQVLGIRIAKLQLDLGVTGANIGDEIDDLVWRDRAHDPQFERPLLRELPRQALYPTRLVVNRLKVWTGHVAKIGEARRVRSRSGLQAPPREA